jgi:oligopeptide transport system substrate-binding protein
MRNLLRSAIMVSAAALVGCSQEVQPPPDPFQLSSARAPCPAGLVCLEAGNGSEPLSLDPHKTQGTWESRIVSDLMVGLTDNDAAGNVIPGMAERWETSEDGRTWTFYLREAQWSDGEPVTADDFVFAFRRILDPSTAAEYASLLYFIEGAQPVNTGEAAPETLGVRAISPRVLEVNLEHPAPYILQLAKHQTMFPVPKHMVEELGDAWSRPESYVSNGPYQLVSWRLGDKVVAERNPYFWDAEEVCIDRVSYYPTDDRAQAERQVRSGELDMHSPIPPNRVPYLRERASMGDYVHSYTYLGNGYLPINTQAENMDDPRVRKALTMAVDREFITEGVFMDTGYEPAYTFVPPGVNHYEPIDPPEWASWSLEERRKEARRLLAEAGFNEDNPLKVEIKHRALEASAMMSSIQNDWRQIGVQTTLRGAETQIAYQYFRLKDFQIGDAGWIADYNDAMSFLYLMDSATGAMNYGAYNNPRYDELLRLANNEPDEDQREQYMREAEEIMMADNPVIPLYYQVNTNLVSPRVTGFVDNISDQHPTRYLCFAERPS